MDELVTVYHGTSLSRAQTILLTGIIRHDASPVWEDTTPGFVYVTLDIGDASWYGKSAVTQDHQHHPRPEEVFHVLGFAVVVFRWKEKPEELALDEDNRQLDQRYGRSTVSPIALSFYTRRINHSVDLHSSATAEMAFINASHPHVNASKNHRSPQRINVDQINWIRLPLSASPWIG